MLYWVPAHISQFHNATGTVWGRRHQQRGVSKAPECPNAIPSDTFPARLGAVYPVLFRDEDLADMYCLDNDRPSLSCLFFFLPGESVETAWEGVLVACAPVGSYSDIAEPQRRPMPDPTASQARRADTSTPAPATILLVGDRAEKLNILETILADSSYRLVGVSPAQVPDAVTKDDFAAIVIDAEMPGGQGIETATRVRDCPRSERTPIILLLPVGESDMRLDSRYALGAVDYVLKPVVPEILRAKVSLFVNLFHAMEQAKLRMAQLTEAKRELEVETAARHRAEEKVGQLMLTDSLTGLLNRRGLTVLGEQQLKLAQRMGKCTLLFVAGLDGGQQIAETLGPQAKNEAVVELAGLLKHTFRESDLLARIGDDEFAILATENMLSGIKAIPERLERNLKAHNAGSGRSAPLSYSLGVAVCVPQNPAPIAELVAQAVQSMHDARITRNDATPLTDG